MKKRIFALTTMLAGLLAGCVVTSLQPYYTAKDLIYEPGLVGNWTNTTKQDERWEFQKAADNSYKLNYVSDGKTNVAKVHLFKLGTQRCMDFTSEETMWDILPPPIPAHMLLRVDQMAPTVRLASVSNNKLKSMLEKQPKAIGHILIGDKGDDARVVLTADTPEMQRFLLGQLKTEGFWDDPFELKRE